MKQFLLLIFLFGAFIQVSAQDNNFKKHEVRVFYGETFQLDIAKGLANGLVDAFSSSVSRHFKTSSNVYGAFGLGYRYNINRFKVGGDLSYIGYRSKTAMNKGGESDYKTSENNFIVMPSAEFVYYKSGILELYGGGGVGTFISLSKSTPVTPEGKKYLNNNLKDKSVDFAYQINPIAVRLGNGTVGGFLELGYGMKGLVNLGVSVKF